MAEVCIDPWHRGQETCPSCHQADTGYDRGFHDGANASRIDRAWHELEERLPDGYHIRSLIRSKGVWEVVVAAPHTGIRIGRGSTPARAMDDIS